MPFSIALVEDDEVLRDCLAEAIRERGHSVRSSPHAEHAMLLFVSHDAPDVLVTDIDLGPGMDGFALAVAARTVHPALPVVYISGRIDGVEGMGPLERFVPKPFTGAVLLGAVDSVRSAFA